MLLPMLLNGSGGLTLEFRASMGSRTSLVGFRTAVNRETWVFEYRSCRTRARVARVAYTMNVEEEKIKCLYNKPNKTHTRLGQYRSVRDPTT